jgi:signal peptidase II
MMRSGRRLVLPSHLSRGPLLLLSSVIVMVDQFSKAWVRNQLQLGVPSPFLPGLLQWRWVRNTGAAFSLFSDSTPVLAFLSLAVGLIVALWIWRSREQPVWQGLAMAFLLGGTLGNGIDRWKLGHVTDFIELVPVSFPIFNGADIAINLAVVCFVIDALSRRHESPSA